MEEKELKIGNQETAILHMLSSQSDPQKALAELVENCIDAKAKNIKILRHIHKGSIEIIISDDGEGVKSGQDGNSDMDRIATSICDSIKKYFDEQTRRNVIGEFALGLLGFSAIGGNLEMISKTKTSTKTKYLSLKRDSIKYKSGDAKKKLKESGTEVRVWPIHNKIKQRFTVEKLNKYLGEELCERIRQTQVSIKIEDRIGRKKEIVVKPLDYNGDRITKIDKVKTPSGNIKFKLYVAQQGDYGKVSIYRKGTKVLDDITEIDGLENEPWNNPLLEGMIDSRFIKVPPATRKGIFPDEQFKELIEAIESIEKPIIEILKEAEVQREQELSRDIIKKLRDAFDDVMGDLSDEYNWFGTKGNLGIKDRDREPRPRGKRLKTRLALGPLEYVTVTPKVSQIAFNEKKKFLAKAWTDKDELIPIDVVYNWKLKPNSLGTLESNNNECFIIAGSVEGEATITLQAILGNRKAEATVSVLILESSNKTAQSNFPRPIGIYKPAENWRTRLMQEVNTLEYNTGHKDYKRAKKQGKKSYLRYFGFLYAKHLVLHNFKESGEDSILERMIEVISSFENRL